MGDSERTQATLGLGTVPDTPSPIKEGSKDTHTQGTQIATEMDICKIPAPAPMDICKTPDARR